MLRIFFYENKNLTLPMTHPIVTENGEQAGAELCQAQSS